MTQRFLQLAKLIRERIESPAGPANQTWLDAIDHNLLDELNQAAKKELSVVGTILEFNTFIREYDTDSADEPKVVLRIDDYDCQQAFSNARVSETLFIRKQTWKKNESGGLSVGPWIVKEEHDASKRSLICSLNEWIVRAESVVDAAIQGQDDGKWSVMKKADIEEKYFLTDSNLTRMSEKHPDAIQIHSDRKWKVNESHPFWVLKK